MSTECSVQIDGTPCTLFSFLEFLLCIPTKTERRKLICAQTKHVTFCEIKIGCYISLCHSFQVLRQIGPVLRQPERRRPRLHPLRPAAAGARREHGAERQGHAVGEQGARDQVRSQEQGGNAGCDSFSGHFTG